MGVWLELSLFSIISIFSSDASSVSLLRSRDGALFVEGPPQLGTALKTRTHKSEKIEIGFVNNVIFCRMLTAVAYVNFRFC